MIERVQVRLGYTSEAGAVSERIVHPLGLVAKGGVWYFVADTAAGRRTFRVDRIRSVELTDQRAVRPEGFDLAEEWRGIAASVEERRTRVRAVVNVDGAVLAGLRVQFGADLTVARHSRTVGSRCGLAAVRHERSPSGSPDGARESRSSDPKRCEVIWL